MIRSRGLVTEKERTGQPDLRLGDRRALTQALWPRVKRTQTTSLNSENVKLPLKMAPDEIISSEDKPVKAAGEENFNEDLRRSVMGKS